MPFGQILAWSRGIAARDEAAFLPVATGTSAERHARKSAIMRLRAVCFSRPFPVRLARRNERFINPTHLPVPLENDTMNPYELNRLQELYASSSAYAQRWKDPPADFVVKWPRDAYGGLFWKDTVLCQESLARPTPKADEDLASRVFGNQLRLKKISVQHQANLLHERAQLYARHVADINSRHIQVQEELFREKLLSPQQASRRQVALEGLLVQLEKDRRQEESDFWKDTRDIRETLFEDATEYQAASHRSSLLGSLGGTNEGD